MMLDESNTASTLLRPAAVLSICTSCRPKDDAQRFRARETWLPALDIAQRDYCHVTTLGQCPRPAGVLHEPLPALLRHQLCVAGAMELSVWRSALRQTRWDSVHGLVYSLCAFGVETSTSHLARAVCLHRIRVRFSADTERGDWT